MPASSELKWENARSAGFMQSCAKRLNEPVMLKPCGKARNLKSALLDAVTHDLRTPLTSIKASITTLLDEQRGEPTWTLDQESRIEMMGH